MQDQIVQTLPQFFFDLIARIIPGLIFILLFFISVPGAWANLATIVEASPKFVGESGGFALVVLILSSYALGHFLAPPSKIVQKLFGKAAEMKAEANNLWWKYDWLRTHSSKTGELTVRLRAEYTMYGALAASFLFAIVAKLIFAPPIVEALDIVPREVVPPSWTEVGVHIFVCGILMMMMASRCGHLMNRWCDSVEKLFVVATDRDSFGSAWKVKKHKIVGVMGSGADPNERKSKQVGQWLATMPVHLLTGGGAGTMNSVSASFASSNKRKGVVIGVIPSDPKSEGRSKQGYPNDWVEIPIYTHLPLSGEDGTADLSRNHINVLSSHVIIALPGGSGTDSEIELAKRYKKPIVIYIDKPQTAVKNTSKVKYTDDFEEVKKFVEGHLSK